MTAFSEEIVAQLAAPLAREHVKQRDQAGRKVSYLEAWHVIAEANRIFGFDGWNREMADCRCVAERETKMGQQQKDGWRVGYVARVRVTVGSVVREGCGYGSGIDADLGAAHESAIKEAESDAMKRALMTFGNQFGLALYDKAQSNVDAPTRRAEASARPIKAAGDDGSGAHARNAPAAAAGIPSAAAPKAKHPKWDYAGARFREIERAVKAAETEGMVDEIIALNEADLGLIEELHEPSYRKLMALRVEMIARLARGSAPALMGEP